ncbi:hypothetical protein F5148DRAFT_1177479 [Russula earlei]|uniref:Uncharacterized protein n=1 Tax=Russula earlei TaxID=71964 RepID=A0ACC0UGG6_9AGAM|nr:hypothetical protein F5148DRAFT_1177479 [Russula earlei]
MSDAIIGNIGEGVEEILAMRGVPVVIAFTNFDLVVSLEEYSESARARAYAQCEELSRSLFRRELKGVPAVIVSVDAQYRDLIGNLVVTTDRLITGSHAATTLRSNAKSAKSRIAPIPLVWSIAFRASQDISIQTSIEVRRSRFWHSLRSNQDFADQKLIKCVTIIHTEIIQIWNMNDKAGLSSPQPLLLSLGRLRLG